MVVVANPDSAKKQVDEFRPKIKAPPLIRLPKHDQSKALHTATRTDTQLSFLLFRFSGSVRREVLSPSFSPSDGVESHLSALFFWCSLQ